MTSTKTNTTTCKQVAVDNQKNSSSFRELMGGSMNSGVNFNSTLDDSFMGGMTVASHSERPDEMLLGESISTMPTEALEGCGEDDTMFKTERMIMMSWEDQQRLSAAGQKRKPLVNTGATVSLKDRMRAFQ